MIENAAVSAPRVISHSWPGQVAAVFRHEWRLLVHSPLSYIFQIGFLLTISVAIFLIADFYNSDEASVRPLLTFLPWVSLIFVPALGMRACQHTDTSTELLLTLPLQLSAVVFGKFLAGYVLLLITLVFTLAFPLTVMYLGEPDPGVVVSTYAACALLLGGYYAVTLFASAVAGQQVAAFVVGLLILFLLTLAGWDAPARVLDGTRAAHWLEYVNQVSPKTWLDALGRGVIEVSSVGYFVLLTAVSLTVTTLTLATRRSGGSPTRLLVKSSLLGVAALAVLALAMPWLSTLTTKLDLTQEKEYTLSDGTRQLVRSLPADTEIQFYWSATEAATPSPIKAHARRTGALLKQMQKHSGGNMRVTQIDPKPDTNAELEAQENLIQKIPMTSGDQFFLGASFRQGDRKTSIPYFDISRDRLTEYDIAVALQGLARQATPKVGLLSPMLAPSAANEDREGLSFVSELRKAYDVAVIPYFASELPKELDLLVLIQPVILQKEMLYAIDQFLMAGGSVAAIMDPFVRLERGVNQAKFEPSTEINDLSDIVMAYGVEFKPGRVVGDQNIAAEVGKPDGSALSYPYWLRITKPLLSSAHPVTASLNELLLVEAGELEILDTDNASPLITTTDKSAVANRHLFTTETPDELAGQYSEQPRQRILAAIVSGNLKSAFSNADYSKDNLHEHLNQSTGAPQLFVIADSDWLFDPFSLQTVGVGQQKVVRPLNDNLAMLLNIVEYASGSPTLLSIRSRGKVRRPFTRVEQLLASARAKHRDSESQLAKRLDLLESEIETTAADASTADNASLQKQRELLPLKRELREIRRLIRQSVERLGQQLVALNLLTGPLLSLLFAAAMRLRRRLGSRHIASNHL